MTQRVESSHGISKFPPILQWVPRYQSGWLSTDIVAGLTTAAVVIPQSIDRLYFNAEQAVEAFRAISDSDVDRRSDHFDKGQSI